MASTLVPSLVDQRAEQRGVSNLHAGNLTLAGHQRLWSLPSAQRAHRSIAP
jgi:hypothetical protein